MAYLTKSKALYKWLSAKILAEVWACLVVLGNTQKYMHTVLQYQHTKGAMEEPALLVWTPYQTECISHASNYTEEFHTILEKAVEVKSHCNGYI
jgi:hypothetical protein